MKARDIMTQNIDYIQADETVLQAAKHMKANDIGAVPVFSGNRIVGIVTDRDIVVRCIANELNPLITSVSTVMSKEIHYCNEFDDLEYVAEIMEEHQIRRILVKEIGGAITGIISLGDLANFLNQNESGEVLRYISEPAKQK